MSKPESTKLTNEDRFRHWREIRRITHDKTIAVEQRLVDCILYGDRVCVATGDDFLVHPEIKAARQKMIDSLPEIMRRAEVKARDKKTGQTEIEL